MKTRNCPVCDEPMVSDTRWDVTAVVCPLCGRVVDDDTDAAERNERERRREAEWLHES